MASFAVDPKPFIPKGFVLDEYQPSPLLHHEVFIIGCFIKSNEDLAIAKLTLPMHKENIHRLFKELKSFFRDIHQVHGIEISPCPLGHAFVKFSNPFEHDRFLGPNIIFGNYNMHFIRHDEVENARALAVDREAMVPLVDYPKDLRNT